jgi:hypothetical protein
MGPAALLFITIPVDYWRLPHIRRGEQLHFALDERNAQIHWRRGAFRERRNAAAIPEQSDSITKAISRLRTFPVAFVLILVGRLPSTRAESAANQSSPNRSKASITA